MGTSWNTLEYEALGVPFQRRGARQEAQVQLLRRLWSKDTTSVNDAWHRLSNVGITPRPLHPIPVWFGGNADAVIDRVARIGDGWFPLARPGRDLEPLLERLQKRTEVAGRPMHQIGIEGFVNFEPGGAETCARQIEAWQRIGASHVSVRTGPTVLPAPRPGIGVSHHLEILQELASVF